MRNENSEPIAAGSLDDPAKQFREFAAECMELARTARSLEKRKVYLEMARVWHQMALRWEKRLQRSLPSRRHQSKVMAFSNVVLIGSGHWRGERAKDNEQDLCHR